MCKVVAYSMLIAGHFPWGKSAGSWRATSSSVKDKKEWSYTSPPSICLHRVDRVNFALIIKKDLKRTSCERKTRVDLKNFSDFTTEAPSRTHLHVTLHIAWFQYCNDIQKWYTQTAFQISLRLRRNRCASFTQVFPTSEYKFHPRIDYEGPEGE